MKNLILSALLILLFSSDIYSQTWVRRLDGIGIWSLTKNKNGVVYAGASGTIRGIYRSTNGGDSWDTILSNGVTNFLSVACDSLNNIYAANGSNGVMKSTDGGANWINIPSSTFNGSTVQVVACGKNGYVYVGVTSTGIYRSTDYGATFPVNVLSGQTFVTIFIDRYNSNIVYAGSSSASLNGLFRSTDAGLTFGDNLNPLNCWGIVQTSPAELFEATTSTGYPFTKSTNGGLNWFTIGTQPGAMRGMTLDLVNNIYICGNGGVFKSTNGGVSFFNAGMTYSGNQIIHWGNRILAAISGATNGGVWLYTDSTISYIPVTSGNIPESYNLYQNYPNPFNPVTNINYDLPKDGLVKLIIYDIFGREVSVSVNEFKKAGSYQMSFDASGFSSGVYFYRIKSGNFTDTKKMLLLK